MKEKFAEWAREHGIAVSEDWSVEQIADVIIERRIPWPGDLINEEGWQLWTAVLRRECAVASIQWDEVSGSGSGGSDEAHNLDVAFRLSDKREFKTRISKSLLKQQDFGTVCRLLEDRLREWKDKDDLEREATLLRADEQFAERMPDLMEYVIGFRAWQLSGARIKPIGAGSDSWQGGREVRASCTNGHLHRAPDPECECGFYAWNSWEFLPVSRGDSRGHVYGVVQAHGRLEIHRTGFRAEFMRPVLLAYDDSEDKLEGAPLGELGNVLKSQTGAAPARLVRGPDYERVKAVADNLGGIPVAGYSTIADEALKYGQFIPANPLLLPDPEQ